MRIQPPHDHGRHRGGNASGPQNEHALRQGGRRSFSTTASTGSGRVTAWVVLVLACLLAVGSVQAVFILDEALNSDLAEPEAMVAPLAKDPAIQTAVANSVSNALLAKRGCSGGRRRRRYLPWAGFLGDSYRLRRRTPRCTPWC